MHRAKPLLGTFARLRSMALFVRHPWTTEGDSARKFSIQRLASRLLPVTLLPLHIIDPILVHGQTRTMLQGVSVTLAVVAEPDH
jgi:hypothetical protein